MKTFFICSSVSCRERMFDCQKISNYFIKNGYCHTDRASKANLIIINTCSFNSEEDDGSINLINYYLRKKNKDSKMIIAGCMPVINPDRLTMIPLPDFATLIPTNLEKLDTLINPNLKFIEIREPNNISQRIVSYRPIFKKVLFYKSIFLNIFTGSRINTNFLEKFSKLFETAFMSICHLKSNINPFLLDNLGSFFYLRISKGCLGNCSYCAKKFATGTLHSKPLSEIIAEFRDGLHKKYKDFYILAEDSGCYGLDIGSNTILLLRELFNAGEKSDFRVTITNFNAQWFVKYYEELEAIFLKNANKINYLQIPIQSGSNRILKLMNRAYRIEEIKGCLLRLKNKVPNLHITTDIIVGFPSETEDDFNLTKNFIEEIGFDYLDIFEYGDRKDTFASKMTDKVTRQIIEERKLGLLLKQNRKPRFNIILKKALLLAKGLS